MTYEFKHLAGSLFYLVSRRHHDKSTRRAELLMPGTSIDSAGTPVLVRLAAADAGGGSASFDALSTAVFRSTSDGVWLLDSEGGTLWTNERLSILLGASREQLRVRHFFDFTADDTAQECFRACQSDRSEQRREMSFGDPAGMAFADVRLIPFDDEDGSSSVLAMITDVTRERQAEAAMLVAVQEFERRLLEHGYYDADGLTRDPAGYRDRLLALTGQIVAANKELEAFSYSVSHDLREPLRSIDGFSRILLERYGPLLDERGKDYLDRVRAAAQRMSRLIGDLLTLSRIARAEMASEPVDITSIARAICSDLAESSPDREVVVAIDDNLTALGDARLLNVVLTNLLGNAWKFTSRRPDARIDVNRQESATDDVFRISDNGAGFEMKYVEKLFRPFQRLHSDADFIGTGVGLATVQRIISRHRGRVWAESTVGEGARVFFSLPRPVASPESFTKRTTL